MKLSAGTGFNGQLRIILLVSFLTFSFLPYNQSFAQTEKETKKENFKQLFTDTTDNKFDISNWLMLQAGFLPYISIITEPALGFGFMAGGIFFDPFNKYKGKTLGEVLKLKKAPPDIGMVMGAYTSNGTWFTGIAYKGYWKLDRLRYTGFAGYMSVNMDYYGEGENQLPQAITFNYKGFLIFQQLDYGITNKLYLGLGYDYSNFNISLENAELPEWIQEKELQQNNGSVKPTLYWDSRDNQFTPNKGVMAKVVYSMFREGLGGDLNYDKFDIYVLSYLPIKKRWTAGLRFDMRFSDDDTPFYSKPYVDIRGVPVMRYQGQYSTVIETEERFNFTPRWAGIGFVGWGRAFNDFSDFSNAENVWAGGAGFRYMLSKPLNLYAGCDVARGPENWAFYITFGSAWGRY